MSTADGCQIAPTARLHGEKAGRSVARLASIDGQTREKGATLVHVRTFNGALAGALLAWPLALPAQDRPDPIVIDKDAQVAINGSALVVSPEGTVSINGTALEVRPDGSVTLAPAGLVSIGNKLHLQKDGRVAIRDPSSSEDRIVVSQDGSIDIFGGQNRATISVTRDGAVTIKSAGQVTIDAAEGAQVSAASKVKPLSVTGALEGSQGIEFRHTNETQGIGFGYDTIYATGSNENQDLNLKSRGSGKVAVRGPLAVEGMDPAQTFPAVIGSVLVRWDGQGELGTGIQNCVWTGAGFCDDTRAPSCRGKNTKLQIANSGSCSFTPNESTGWKDQQTHKGDAAGQNSHCVLYLCYSGPIQY